MVRECIVFALILLAMTVILALTLPHLKIFQPIREHAEVLFALIYAPAITAIVILLGCVIVLYIKLVEGA
ncbi:hypothetical protein [Ligilactobacillus salivarius]|uniref:Uncharacterized protein n=1 Tax=Ligilactobacillus salivarius TaxID=1624 RepID=A0ABD7YXQ0_9LACO|nr:hypothetical protein [Ligilactobacillus salivarius]WHS05143.1 hypothetical protein O2U07_01490 [Ligilactobacillus salivarius]WHS07067.1 hypothetical protein O2U05_00410 [Ligilactobacillus salivarius]WHS11087.1 hypothetical protein O2U04_09865 [Ligilactobacillus salivarius]WHS15362.1 hypothetical protein O2U03_10720 [Ligilactobacillus salivarius]WHS18905.1 hypothetical protein O2U02_10875 [Ligilactobacillus salivarius]